MGLLTIFRWVLLVKPNFLVEPCIVMINIKHLTHYVVLKLCPIRKVQTNTVTSSFLSSVCLRTFSFRNL